MKKTTHHRLLLILLTAAALASTAAPPRDAISFFTHSGADTAFPEISANRRLDMIDYLQAGQLRAMENNMHGQAQLIEADSMHISLTPAAYTRTDLYLLPGPADTLLMIVETLQLPQPDSRITFYNTDWTPCQRQPLTPPVLTDWLTDAGAKDRADTEQRLPFILASATYSPATQTLTLTNTLADYYPDAADRKFISRNIRHTLTYRWTGTRFQPITQK